MVFKICEISLKIIDNGKRGEGQRDSYLCPTLDPEPITVQTRCKTLEDTLIENYKC